MTHSLAITAAKTATLLLGGAITYFAWGAYRRTGAPALRALTIGFGIVTAGAVLSGAIDQFTPIDTLTVVLINSLLTALGFAVILRSLYVE